MSVLRLKYVLLGRFDPAAPGLSHAVALPLSSCPPSSRNYSWIPSQDLFSAGHDLRDAPKGLGDRPDGTTYPLKDVKGTFAVNVIVRTYMDLE